MHSPWIKEASRLALLGYEEEASETVYDAIDIMLLMGWFEELDQHLMNARVEAIPSVVLMCILVSTYDLKEVLLNRSSLVDRVARVLRRRRHGLYDLVQETRG